MKVKVTVTLDIDVDAWMLNYGINSNEVRADVKGYFADVCQGQLQRIDCDNVINHSPEALAGV